MDISVYNHEEDRRI